RPSTPRRRPGRAPTPAMAQTSTPSAGEAGSPAKTRGGQHALAPLRGNRMTTLTPKQEELCQQRRWDFTDLRALFINCTLKRSPELSHTQGLPDISMQIMRRQGPQVGAI